jgi:hypothetical protein
MQLYVPRTFTDGIGNVCKGWLTALAVDETATVQANPSFSLAAFQTVLHPRHLWRGDCRVPLYTCRLRVLASEHDGQKHLPTEDVHYLWHRPELDNLYSPHLIEWHYDRAALSQDVLDRVHRSLDGIELLPAISDRVAGLTGQVQGRSLGLAIRTWRAAHEQGVQRPYSEKVWLNAIEAELQDVETVVVCADRHDTLEAYCGYLAHWPVRLVVPASVSVDNLTQAAFVQMATLAACDVLIGSGISTFTELAWWWGRNRARVVPLF